MSATAEDLAGVQPQGTDTESLPGGVQAPDLAPVPQSEDEWESALDSMDSDTLGALLSAPPATQPAAQNEDPPIVNATPADEEEEEEEQASAPAPQTSAALAHPGAPARIRLNGIPEEQASKVAQYVDAIRSGKSPEEAAAILAPPAPAAVPAPEQAPAAAPATQTARPEPVAPPEVDAARARVTEAEEALAAAKLTYDAAEISDRTIALIDAKAELKDAEHAARQEQVNAASYNQQFDQHVASLRQSFPELDDENSPIAVRLDELRDLESVRNPGFDQDPAFILRLAAKAAQDVGARTAANTPIPQPGRTAKPQGRVTPGGQPVAKAMTKEDANRQFDQVLDRMSDEEKQDFLANILPIPG
jgi:hypothetical protein